MMVEDKEILEVEQEKHFSRSCLYKTECITQKVGFGDTA